MMVLNLLPNLFDTLIPTTLSIAPALLDQHKKAKAGGLGLEPVNWNRVLKHLIGQSQFQMAEEIPQHTKK